MPKKKAVKAQPTSDSNKRHPVHATSLIEIAGKIREHAKNEQVDTNSSTAILLLIADVIEDEGKRVQKILR